MPGFWRLPGSTHDDRIGRRSTVMLVHIGLSVVLGFVVGDLPQSDQQVSAT
jgi:hypothetical protein